MRISRLLAIITILMREEKVTAKALAQRFEVSQRTIIRDMEAIDMAGIPIVSYQGYEGGYAVMESYKLDKSVFTDSELSVMLASLKGIDQVFADGNVKNVISKLEHTARNLEKEHFMIDLASWGVEDLEKQTLQLFQEAIAGSNCVAIYYYNYEGVMTERTIEPHMVCLKKSTWYVYAYCQRRNDFRLFKLLRMDHVKVLEKTFERKPFDSEEIFSEYDLGLQPELIKLAFLEEAKGRMYDYFDYSTISDPTDGYIYVTLSAYIDKWLIGTILSFGSSVKVIQPETLISTIKEEAVKILQNYQ